MQPSQSRAPCSRARAGYVPNARSQYVAELAVGYFLKDQQMGNVVISAHSKAHATNSCAFASH